ncbi:MAG: cupin domain-containing protein [Planctomycetaceae bacterium]
MRRSFQLRGDPGGESEPDSHEQGGIFLQGTLELQIGDETRRVTAGSLFLIPPNTPHRA